jgi:hypothetical protein
MSDSSELTPLKNYLDKLTILEEEKKMWLDAGFYIGMNFESGYANGTGTTRMVGANGRNILVDSTVVDPIRKKLMASWEALSTWSKTKEAARKSIQDDVVGQLGSRDAF